MKRLLVMAGFIFVMAFTASPALAEDEKQDNGAGGKGQMFSSLFSGGGKDGGQGGGGGGQGKSNGTAGGTQAGLGVANSVRGTTNAYSAP